MISKELFEVLNIPPFPNHDDQFIVDDNCIILSWGGEIHDEINIYELAHKCKEWANDNDYTLLSGIHSEPFVPDTWVCTVYGEIGNPTGEKDFFDYTEPKAIFKACEYILKEY